MVKGKAEQLLGRRRGPTPTAQHWPQATAACCDAIGFGLVQRRPPMTWRGLLYRCDVDGGR